MNAALLASALLLVSNFAHAHVEPGKHVGKTVAGAECSMVADKTYFEKDTKHPLNERIKVTVDATEYLVGHPPVIDVKNTVVHFNHDLFQGVSAIKGGAKALIIDMIHSANKEGPTRFTVIENDWKSGKKTALVCDGLTFAK